MRTSVLLIAAVGVCSVLAQHNPPVWPESGVVKVFGPSTPASTISAAINAAFSVNGGHDPPNRGQFSSHRFAFLFEPGTYGMDVPVSFYMDVRGLGTSPDDTIFSSEKGVFCEEGDYVYSGGALVTFWRGAENLKTTPTFKWATATGMMWAVSQAAILNRVHVTTQLSLYEYQPPYQGAGYASGGYMSNSQVDGTTFSGSQQQWYSRNTQFGVWNGGVWNMVFSGCPGAPSTHCSDKGGLPITTAASTPVIAEKPYISIDSSGMFSLNVPALRTNAVGTDWAPGTQIDFTKVYIANNVTDTAATINAALAKGMHVILTGGLYSLTDSIQVNNANTVVMGLGWPTLITTGGKPAIAVGNVDGVRLAGPILLQASATRTPTLLQVGDGTYAGNAANPTFVYSVFARVGGPDTFEVFADAMFRIDSGHVVIDGTWLWRADHTVSGSVTDSKNPCYNGLVVTGDNVVAYGLAIEHTLQDLAQWSGQNGVVHFLQEELPYDVTQAQYGDMGYTGFRLNSTVKSFSGLGMGVYSFFRDYNVTVESGIVSPPGLESSFVNPMTVFLNGKGTIEHVINKDGPATGVAGGGGGKPAWYCQ